VRNVLRGIASLAMLAALALPAYTCSGYVAPNGQIFTGIPTGADSAAFRPTQIAHYPMEGVTPSDAETWWVIFAYGWPVAWLGLRRSRRIARHRATLAITQGLLAVAAGFLIFGSMMGKLASGTYVALGALSILLGDALYDLWTIIRTRRATVPAG
jgi:hypothetical protein